MAKGPAVRLFILAICLITPLSALGRQSVPRPWTPLHAAAAKGDVTAARLIFRGANVNAGADKKLQKDNFIRMTPLHAAAEAGRVEVAKLLVSKRANVNARTNYGQTPLEFAAGLKDPSLALFLLSNGAAANVKDTGSRTPLQAASASGNLALVRALIAKGADVNLTSNFGDSPLHLAANGEVARLLISKGAKFTANPKWEVTPLQKAFGRTVEGGNYRADVAHVLIEHGARIPLVEAVSAYDTGILQLLLSKGAPIDGRDGEGQTALVVAAGEQDTPLPDNLAELEFGSAEQKKEMLRKRLGVVEFLLRHGANIEARDKNGGTALLRAAERGRPEMVKLLLSKDADHGAQDKSGNTPLHRAAAMGKLAAGRVLLSHGADVNAKNIEGRTPLQVAQESAKHADDPEIREIIRLLQQADASSLP